GTISQFPEQFSARLEVTAHLVDRTKGYPPWLRTMYITYDRPAGRAKVVVNDGVDAGKTFLRLYQQKKEYMIREGEFAGCRRSYLGEAMPIPQLPITATFEGVVLLEGAYCEHWLQDDSMSRVHIYIDRASQVPRRLTEEAAVTGDVDVPLVTYEFRDIVVGPPVLQLFDLPAEYASREACDLSVGGFSYLHLFHHYLRV
ncbi:unnamed protein product, partial [Sphacelaria rigidula]